MRPLSRMAVAIGVMATWTVPVVAQRDARIPEDSGSAIFIPNSPNFDRYRISRWARSETISGIAMEQDLDRPYVYVSRMQHPTSPAGFTLISVKDPAHARIIYQYHIADPELHS